MLDLQWVTLEYYFGLDSTAKWQPTPKLTMCDTVCKLIQSCVCRPCRFSQTKACGWLEIRNNEKSDRSETKGNS